MILNTSCAPVERGVMNLLPCPYCGGDAQHYPEADGQANSIYCNKCPVGVQWTGMRDEDLKNIWNGLPRTAGEALTSSYVQRVPDQCDRIVWRGKYMNLPLQRKRQRDVK